MKTTFIEVCAGAGGISSGFIKAGLEPVLVNEMDKTCCETLATYHPEFRHVIHRGLMQDLLHRTDLHADVLVGGVPCQSFSQAGRRMGLDDQKGNLMMVFIDLIHTIRPKVFIIENVKGLMTHDNGLTLKRITDRIDNTYTLSVECLNAVDYGVPQKRERVFIVGSVYGRFTFPPRSHTRRVLKDVLSNVPPSTGLSYSKEKRKLFSMIPLGGCWVDLPVPLAQSYMKSSWFSGGGKRGILRRLSMDEPSLTLLCSPSQKQTERCHPIETRPFTVREYARIQTFPDDYEFSGSVHQQYKQIGNAVPVELAYQLGRSIVSHLLKH